MIELGRPEHDPGNKIEIRINLRALYATLLFVAFAFCILGVFGAWR